VAPVQRLRRIIISYGCGAYLLSDPGTKKRVEEASWKSAPNHGSRGVHSDGLDQARRLWLYHRGYGTAAHTHLIDANEAELEDILSYRDHETKWNG
jgi:hypothetical protein